MKKLDSNAINKLLNVPAKEQATRRSAPGILPVLHDITPEQRKHPLAKCECCPLYTQRYALTCGPSPDEAKVAFVSRSPGNYDVAAGKPFANPRGAGAVLDHLLARYRVRRTDVLTTNIVLCRTDDPPKEAIEACKPRLEAEIANCELIILGGTEATSALTRYRAVFTARPFIHRRTSISGTPQRVIVTNNPALVVRNSDAYPDMVEDFRRAFDPPPPPVFPEVEIINDASSGRNILERYAQDGVLPGIVASDLEWFPDGRPTCAGFSARGEKAVVFGLGVINDGRCWDLLRRIYERSETRFVWHNGKADTKVLVSNGIDGRIDEDTFLQSYALDERPGYHSLEYLLSTKFGWPDYEPASVKHFKKTGEFLGKTAQERELSERELYKYNGWDTAGTLQLFNLLDSRLYTDRGGEVRTLYKRLLKAQTRFRTVELSGFHFDVVEAANINEREAIPRIYELTDHIREVTGHALLNPNSPDQLKAVLYGEWGVRHNLRDSGKKKLSTSTGKEVREEITAGRFECRHGHREQLVRWAEFQAQYSKISKLKGTYLEGLALRTLKDGKLYCHFNPCGTVSGRASSNDPNFQNIAREGYEEIPGIRTLFLPSRGNLILSADFSQAELRTCAKLSGDTNLLAIYRDSTRSLHRERAAAFYGENYTKEEYVKCFHPSTEVLTTEGWLKVGEVTTETNLLQAIPKNDGLVDLEWTKPNEVYKGKSDKLMWLKNEGINIRVTPNHRMVGWSNEKAKPHEYIPGLLGRARKWANAGILDEGSNGDEKLLRLAVAIQADGTIRNYGAVTFGFKKAEKIDRLIKFLNDLNIEFTLTEANEVARFYIPKQDKLSEAIQYLDDDKTLSWQMLSLDLKSRLVILDELQYWDATKDQPGWKMYMYHSYTRKNIDVAQALATTCGMKTHQNSTGESLSIKDHPTSRGGNLTVQEIDYNSEVICLSVPSTYLVVRDVGIPIITGNSKNINFGVTYGQSAAAFAQMYHMPQEEADEYIKSWWREFPDLLEWTKEQKAKARKEGLVQSPFGHKRRFHLITDENVGDVEREAVNFLPQNIAAWLTISALCELVDMGIRVVATVHDSIVADVPGTMVQTVAETMKEVMESQVEKQLGWTDIPFLVDISVGPNWGIQKEFELGKALTDNDI